MTKKMEKISILNFLGRGSCCYVCSCCICVFCELFDFVFGGWVRVKYIRQVIKIENTQVDR